MTAQTCEFCERDAVAKGMCLMHYKRKRNGKDPAVDPVPVRAPLAERFNAKYAVDDITGCWNWIGAVDPKGYGFINLGGRKGGRNAARVAYELFIGPLPEGEGHHGTCVCHRCDNTGCVNPEHLFIGTVADNNRDMWGKGRGRSGAYKGMRHNKENHPRGSKHPMAKLTEAQVIAARRRMDGGLPFKTIAQELGISRSYAWAIKSRRSWRHL